MGKCRLWVNVAMGICRMGICRMGICRLTGAEGLEGAKEDEGASIYILLDG